jgi:hypothetical protein
LRARSFIRMKWTPKKMEELLENRGRARVLLTRRPCDKIHGKQRRNRHVCSLSLFEGIH